MNKQSKYRSNKSSILLTISLICISMMFAAAYFSGPVRPVECLVTGVKHLVDTKKQLTISRILASDTDGLKWQEHDQKENSLGISKNTHWFKANLTNLSPTKTWLVEIDYPLLDNIHLWFVKDNKVLAEYQVGDTLPFSQRPIVHENFLFPIPTNKQNIDLYVSSHSNGAMRLSLKIWQQESYLSFATSHSLAMGVFFGVMLAMGLSNLCFFITTRAPAFLVYAGYVTFLALTLSTLQGLGYRYIWPGSPWLQQHAVVVFGNLTVCLSIMFCNLLLNVKVNHRQLSRALQVAAGIYLAFIFASFLVPLQSVLKIFLIMLLTSGILVLVVATWLWIKGIAIAGYYMLAWTVLFICGLAFSLDTLNLIDLNLPPYYLLMLGAGIETMLLAFILAISHNQQRQNLLDTQADLLEKERHAQRVQKDMLALQEGTTEELEYKVQERTLELEIALRELSDINRELEEKNTLDALTGIRNRSYFDKKYQAEMRRSRREQTPLSIVMIDIDHFKRINDQYGHLVGDECIKAVAKTLQASLKRPSDAVCRYGGEEFALILPNTDLEGAQSLIEKLRATIEENSIQTEGKSINVTISAGIGTAITNLDQVEESILALADKQLYAAKNAGRNNVQGAHLNAFKQQD